jgi:hypothetical protein
MSSCMFGGARRNKSVVMILLESLPSYKYLMTTLKTMQMKEFTMEYVMTRLMHEVSKKKEKGPKDDSNGVASRQNDNSSWYKDVNT